MRVKINKHIVVDDRVCHGKATFKGTRIMVWQVLDLLKAGVTPRQIMGDYFPELTKAAILSALDYASQTIEDERYVLFH